MELKVETYLLTRRISLGSMIIEYLNIFWFSFYFLIPSSDLLKFVGLSNKTQQVSFNLERILIKITSNYYEITHQLIMASG